MDADELRADGTFVSLVVGAPLADGVTQASVDRRAPCSSSPTRPRRACVLFMGHGAATPRRAATGALAAACGNGIPLCSWAR